MKNFLIAALLLVAVIGGVAIYRGWFAVNTAKVEQDEAAVKKEVHELEQKVKDKASDLGHSVKTEKK